MTNGDKPANDESMNNAFKDGEQQMTTIPPLPSERKKWPTADNTRGLACRNCGCSHFRVIYSRPMREKQIIRRRECRHCGKRMTTLEHELGNKPGT